MLRFFRRECEREAQIPSSYVRKHAELCVAAQQAWGEAHKKNDFAIFAPYLERMFSDARAYSGFFDADHIYTPLLDRFEPGFSAVACEKIIADLRAPQVALVQRALGSSQGEAILARTFNVGGQKRLSRTAAKLLGFDFNAGRIDTSMHPFTSTCGVHDVRITTHYRRDLSSLFSTLHEAGHALYEQNVGEEIIDTLHGAPASLVLHESQSRLWENMVGRSEEFLGFLWRYMVKYFPRELDGVTLDAFTAAANRVSPGAIRVDADEATYNLHIMLRFELELALLRREIKVAELPAIWREKMRDYLGITPATDTDGVLQDIHWSCGLIGYFPTYLLGNLAAAQFWCSAGKALPDLRKALAEGNTKPLRNYLIDNIYRHGGLCDSDEIIEATTGAGISSSAYLAYLNDKLSRFYPGA